MIVALVVAAFVATDSPDVAQVRAILMPHLKDPLSAQIIVTKGPWRQKAAVMGDRVEGDWYCAEVNAKNDYGGYTGLTKYLLVDGPGDRDLAWRYSEGGLYAIDRIGHRMCSQSEPAK
jgi:hypothetical protein